MADEVVRENCQRGSHLLGGAVGVAAGAAARHHPYPALDVGQVVARGPMEATRPLAAARSARPYLHGPHCMADPAARKAMIRAE